MKTLNSLLKLEGDQWNFTSAEQKRLTLNSDEQNLGRSGTPKQTLCLPYTSAKHVGNSKRLDYRTIPMQNVASCDYV